jgi:hypothetical protein
VCADERMDDEQVRRELGAICERTIQRAARQSAIDWTQLSPGSQLADDDQRSEPFYVSHAAVDGIVVATESMHAVATLLVGGITYASMPFIAARVAIESAANVVWMLSPESSAERIRRFIVLTRLDLVDVRKMAREFQLDLDQAMQQQLANLEQLAAPIIGDIKVKLNSAADTSSTARVRIASQLLGAESDCLLAWMVGSGFAHGRPWASDMMLRTVDVRDAESVQRVVGSLPAVLWVMTWADAMLTRALQLFNERGAVQPDAS